MNNNLEIPEEICRLIPNSKMLAAYKLWIKRNQKYSYFLVTPKVTFFDRWFREEPVYPDNTISRIGGFPPVLDEDLQQLTKNNWKFLCQLNLEDISSSILPRQGILAIFLNRDQKANPVALRFYAKDQFDKLYKVGNQLKKLQRRILPIKVVKFKSFPTKNDFGLESPELSGLESQIKEMVI